MWCKSVYIHISVAKDFAQARVRSRSQAISARAINKRWYSRMQEAVRRKRRRRTLCNAPRLASRTRIRHIYVSFSANLPNPHNAAVSRAKTFQRVSQRNVIQLGRMIDTRDTSHEAKYSIPKKKKKKKKRQRPDWSQKKKKRQKAARSVRSHRKVLYTKKKII